MQLLIHIHITLFMKSPVRSSQFRSSQFRSSLVITKVMLIDASFVLVGAVSLPAVGGGHTGVLSVGAVPCSRKFLSLRDSNLKGSGLR